MANLEIIEGIGPVFAQKLRAIGVRSVEALLEKGATPKGRKELADKSGIGHELILDWVNRADLMRIKGVGEEYSDLLEKAGVDTVKELRNRRADRLFEAMAEINADKHLVRRLPTRKMVAAWVEEAKSLPPKLEY